MYVYILTNFRKSTLYIGITNNLCRRLYEHRSGSVYFTSKYKCYRLAYFEYAESPTIAIEREKQLKGWARARKESLIESANPNWEDLAYRFELRDA